MVLPNKATGPVEVGVKGASHHLALVVDAGGNGGTISRQNAEWTVSAPSCQREATRVVPSGLGLAQQFGRGR